MARRWSVTRVAEAPARTGRWWSAITVVDGGSRVALRLGRLSRLEEHIVDGLWEEGFVPLRPHMHARTHTHTHAYTRRHAHTHTRTDTEVRPGRRGGRSAAHNIHGEECHSFTSSVCFLVCAAAQSCGNGGGGGVSAAPTVSRVVSLHRAQKGAGQNEWGWGPRWRLGNHEPEL